MDFRSLHNRLGYQFRDTGLLETALTHRSASNTNNERMEFLGDSILGMVISTELYKRFPHASEGELSRLRASLVKGETLAKLANSCNLGEYLILGSGELKSGGFRRKSILADTFEALIGAVYLDSDMEAARHYVLSFYETLLEQCDPTKVIKDPKTRLQEYLQSRGEKLPEYNVLNISGKEHNQVFEVECRISGTKQATIATGSSRRKAEQAAAQRALELLRI